MLHQCKERKQHIFVTSAFYVKWKEHLWSGTGETFEIPFFRSFLITRLERKKTRKRRIITFDEQPEPQQQPMNVLRFELVNILAVTV